MMATSKNHKRQNNKKIKIRKSVSTLMIGIKSLLRGKRLTGGVIN